MPTLIRLLLVLAFLGACGYAGMFALATFVKPQQAEMTIRIPAEKLNPPPADTGG